METNIHSTSPLPLLVSEVGEERERRSQWPVSQITRAHLLAVIDEFAETLGGRRVLHTWDDHELADAVELIAEGPRVDALLLRSRDLAAAFGTDLFDTLPLGEEGRASLPDLVAAFVPYAHALRGLSAHDTAASLGVIESCRASFVDPFEVQVTKHDAWRRSLDRWRPSAPPGPYECLIMEVGSEEAPVALTAVPLPEDEVADLTAVADDVRDRLGETLDIADPEVSGRSADDW